VRMIALTMSAKSNYVAFFVFHIKRAIRSPALELLVGRPDQAGGTWGRHWRPLAVED
jgi:hypothetical protein